jgi:hypothetical protein
MSKPLSKRARKLLIAYKLGKTVPEESLRIGSIPLSAALEFLVEELSTWLPAPDSVDDHLRALYPSDRVIYVDDLQELIQELKSC